MLLRFVHLLVYWLVLLCAITAADSSLESGARYERVDGHLLPYEEQELALLRRAPKREIRLRTANGFGKRDDLGSPFVNSKRVDSKIKKLQLGALRTAIGFGKRSVKYRTPETDPAFLLKMDLAQTGNYPSEWYSEEAAENDPDQLLKIIRELKHNTNDEASPQMEEPARNHFYSRFTLG